MTGPKRLVDLTGLGPMERLALEEARAMEPPPALREEVWKGLEAAILSGATAGAAVALAEGASSGSQAVASTGVGGKAAAIGAAMHGGFAVLPAIKVVAATAVVLGATAGVGFAFGRGWSALTQRDAKSEAPVVEASRTAAPSRAASLPPAARATRQTSQEPALVGDLGAAPAVAPVAPDARTAAATGNSRAAGSAGGEAFHSAGSAPQPVLRSIAGFPIAAPRASARVPGQESATPSAGPTRAAVSVPSSGPTKGAPIYGADEESLLASEAREALRAGDPRRSLALLRRMRGLGGGGVLVEERALLEIEALVNLGDRDEARERARAFLQTWPASVYSNRVQAMLREL